MKKEKSVQNLIIFAYFIFNIYYFYRYLFQYNSEITSPTYSNSPLGFQVAKYVIAIGILSLLFVLLFVNNVIDSVKINVRVPELLMILCILFCFIKSVQQSDFDYFIKYFLFMLVAYGVIFIQNDSFEKRFIKINKIIFYYHLVYSLLQILLFVSVGRLPALAYRAGLVRFGGGWDDPNAFALYLIIPYTYLLNLILGPKAPKKKCKLYILLITSIILEILTFSFTGYLSFLIASVCIAVKQRDSKKLPKLLLIALIAVMLVCTVAFRKIIALISLKSGSLLIHFGSLNLLGEGGFKELLIGSGSYQFYENHFKIVLANFGIPYFLLNLCLSVYFIVIGYRVQKHYGDNNVYFVCSLFVFIYTVVQFALPFSIIFPVNFIYWVAAFMLLGKYRLMQKQDARNRKTALLEKRALDKRYV